MWLAKHIFSICGKYYLPEEIHITASQTMSRWNHDEHFLPDILLVFKNF